MLELAAVAVSTGFLFTISLVLFSCASCRRFFDKKKEDEKEERVNIPEIKIDIGDDKDENGISNPGYQETSAAETKSEVIEQKDEAVIVDGEKNVPVQVVESANIEQHTDPPVNEDDQLKDEKQDDIEVPQTVDNQSCSNKDAGIENTAYEETADVEAAAEKQNDQAQSNIKERLVDYLNSDVHNSEVPTVKEEDDEAESEEANSEPIDQTVTHNNDSEELDLSRYENVVFQGEWRQPVSLSHLLLTGLISKDIAEEIVKDLEESKAEQSNDEDQVPDKIARFLKGDEPVAGIIVTDTGEKKSIFKSAKDGILRRGTAISLLEAQAATGNIIDPVTGRKMSVKEAAQLGLLDKVYETVLLRAERAVTGYKFRASEHVLSLYEAMQKGLVVESHGLRLLEAQNATGGIIDHRINIRVPLDVAVERGILDDKLKGKLEDEDGEETKTFFDPNTEQNVTYSELMRRSVVDNDTGLRLYPLERMTKKRVNYGSYSGRSSLASSKNASRSNSKENIPAAVADS